MFTSTYNGRQNTSRRGAFLEQLDAETTPSAMDGSRFGDALALNTLLQVSPPCVQVASQKSNNIPHNPEATGARFSPAKVPSEKRSILRPKDTNTQASFEPCTGDCILACDGSKSPRKSVKPGRRSSVRRQAASSAGFLLRSLSSTHTPPPCPTLDRPLASAAPLSASASSSALNAAMLASDEATRRIGPSAQQALARLFFSSSPQVKAGAVPNRRLREGAQHGINQAF